MGFLLAGRYEYLVGWRKARAMNEWISDHELICRNICIFSTFHIIFSLILNYLVSLLGILSVTMSLECSIFPEIYSILFIGDL